MNCTNCGQPLDNGAVYCGNCGQPVAVAASTAPANVQTASPLQTVAQPVNPPVAPYAQSPTTPAVPQVVTLAQANGAAMPAYARPNPSHQKGEAKAVIGLIISVLALPAALIPIVGLILGVAGLVLGSLSLRIKKVIAILAIVFGIIAIIASLALWVMAFNELSKEDNLSKVTKEIDTPCYTVKVSEDLKVSDQNGCSFQAMNQDTVATSTVVTGIEASPLENINESNFEETVKKAVPIFIQAASTTERKYTTASERSDAFANKKAYVVNAKSNENTEIEVVFVYNPSAAGGFGIFVASDARLSGKADAMRLAQGFEWK